MTKRETADVADKIIGAAQELEKAAKRMKETARNMRRGHLHESIPVDLWLMHRSNDVREAAEKALIELGTPDEMTLKPWRASA